MSRKDIIAKIKDEMRDVIDSITERAEITLPENNEEGLHTVTPEEEEQLLSVEISGEVFEHYDDLDAQNHNFDIGRLHGLKFALQLIENGGEDV